MTLIGRKILLTNTDESGNPTLDFPITSIECVEGGASQEDLETTNNTLTENTTNLQNQINNLTNELTFLGSNMAYVAQISEYMFDSYVTFSNTLQIVAGKVTLRRDTTYASFTFPKAFLSPPTVVLTGISDTMSNSVTLKSAPTATGFTVLCNYAGATVHYIAFGMGAVVL